MSDTNQYLFQLILEFTWFLWSWLLVRLSKQHCLKSVSLAPKWILITSERVNTLIHMSTFLFSWNIRISLENTLIIY